MKLSGTWVTVNNSRRYVRPEPAVAPVQVLRSKKVRKKKKARKPDLRRVPGSVTKFPKVRATLVQDHRRLLERRAAGIYDRPVLTPYALGLLAAAGHTDSYRDLLAAASMQSDQRVSRITWSIVNDLPYRGGLLQDDRDHFEQFYLLGSAFAAAHPGHTELPLRGGT